METQQDAVLNVDNPGTKLTNRNNHSEIDPKQTALLTTATALVTNLNTWYHTVFVTICLKVLCCCNCYCKHDRSGM